MTGSLSAMLVLLGLGISVASTFGAKIPAESILQLATWALPAVCGGQAAYSVWAREHEKVLNLQRRFEPRFTLVYDPDDPICKASLQFGESRAPGRGLRIRVENVSEEIIRRCEARLVETHRVDKPNEISSTKLNWVGDSDTADLVRGAPEYIGVLSVISTGQKQVPTKGWSLAHMNMFDDPGEYLFRIVVTAENAQQKEYRVIATLTENWQNDDMRPV